MVSFQSVRKDCMQPGTWLEKQKKTIQVFLWVTEIADFPPSKPIWQEDSELYY